MAGATKLCITRYLWISQFQQCPFPLPRKRGAFAHVVSPGGGAFAILSRPGGWAFAYPWALDTRVFESAMDEFIGKDGAFVEHWLVRQELEKLVDVFKGMFSQF